jgi:hypothetical protein
LESSFDNLGQGKNLRNAQCYDENQRKKNLESSDFNNPPCAANCPYVRDHENRIETCEQMAKIINKKVSYVIFLWILGGFFACLLFMGGYHIKAATRIADENIKTNESISDIKSDIEVIKTIIEKNNDDG